MTRLVLTTLFLCLSVSVALTQKKSVEIAYHGGIKAIYEYKDGILHGNYQSYYSNGKKCAEGQFENNLRIGTWSVWDSTGKLRVERFYESPFVYQTTFPKTPTSPLITLLNVPQYRPKRNEDGFIDYHFIHEKMVFLEQLIWRYLPNNVTNSFWINQAYKKINTMVLAQEIKSYNNDEFEQELVLDTLPIENAHFIGFKIKEVYFFDTDRFLSENRILGICPVVVDKTKKDTTDLYWVYYPETRPLLAKLNLNTEINNTAVQNYDDIFFFRSFSSYIYRKSTFYGKKGNFTYVLSKQTLEEQSDKTEINNIEFEHMTWISFSRGG